MRQYSEGVRTLKHIVFDKEKRNTGIRCITTATKFVIRRTMNSTTSMQHQQKKRQQEQ